MALMDFIKKQFIDIIQWTEEDDGTLAWRFPMAGMEIQSKHSVNTRGRDYVGNEFGGNRCTTSHFPILTSVSVVRHYGSHPACRGPFESINHHEKFHNVVVDRLTGGLDDEYVHSSDIFPEFNLYLPVAE